MRNAPIRHGLVLGGLIIVVLWLLTSIWNLGSKALVAVSEAHDLERQYESLQARQAALQASLGALSTERGEDAAIRTAFGVARPGEEVIVVVPPATTTPPVEKSWWQRFVEWF